MGLCSLGVQFRRSELGLAAFVASAIFLQACMQANGPAPPQRPQESSVQPTIDAAPTQAVGDQWQVATAETVTLTITAPGAESVKILYRPVVVQGRHIELAKLRSPIDATQGKFSTQIKLGPDFAGEVWAEALYRNGEKRQTSPIGLTTEAASVQSTQNPSARTDESAREDKLTGGHIEKAAFQPGQPNTMITVNAPAFELTLWQNGKEVKTYRIGIGRKTFPLPVGQRKATEIVFNPEWVPPDSSWVEDDNVEPGERIEPDDPRNPLGKIKIPLGEGILIHEAVKPSDIGHLVSHGCVRLMTDDLFDLAEKIIAAHSLPISSSEIERLKTTKDRKAVKLDSPLFVDINYDTLVIEGGVLHIYPDVYNHNTNTVEELRTELQTSGVDASAADDKTLKQMLSRATMNEEFVVSTSDIKAGRALDAGRTQPLTPQSVRPTAAPGPSSRGRRR
jgi:lipoprotein-anchoring transpeptidase ErfK/SrfK